MKEVIAYRVRSPNTGKSRYIGGSKRHLVENWERAGYEVTALIDCRDNDLLQWAVDKWKDEVANRPLVNIHRRTLDDTWRQVIRRAGGDPDALVGPSHDTLVMMHEQS